MAAELDARTAGQARRLGVESVGPGGDEAGMSIENGMFPLEAESEAKKNHMFFV
jgi:hypothetical protein